MKSTIIIIMKDNTVMGNMVQKFVFGLDRKVRRYNF